MASDFTRAAGSASLGSIWSDFTNAARAWVDLALGIENQGQRGPVIPTISTPEPNRLTDGLLGLREPAGFPQRLAEARGGRDGCRIFAGGILPKCDRAGPHLLPLSAGQAEEGDRHHGADERPPAGRWPVCQPGRVEQAAHHQGHPRHRQG